MPEQIMGPFANETESHNLLISPASGHGLIPQNNTSKHGTRQMIPTTIHTGLISSMGILKLIISSLERMVICPDFLIGNQLDGFKSIGNIQQQ